jgi:hypothetical protein
MHNGITVSTFEIPAAWQAQSRVNWNYQNLSFPVTISAIAYNPNGLEAVEVFPVDSFYWLEPDYGFNQQGQNNLGQICLRPASAEQTMMNWVLPKYRGNRMNLRVIGAIPMPDLPQKINLPLPNMQTESIAVKIEFTENNQIIEEILYGIKVQQQAPPTYGAGGMIVQTNWGFARLFSFRARQGQLEDNRDVFWHIVGSGKTNPQWEQMYQQILGQMQQQFNQYLQAGYDQINAATQMSRQISAQNDAWLANQAHKREADHIAFEQKRQQDADAWGRYTNNDAFGDYMMGRETYQDPNAPLGEVQIDGYHDYVWTNQREEYIPTNDANFDPNVGSNENWVLLKKKNIGDK